MSFSSAPRVDGDPAFCSLLNGDAGGSETAHGYWDIELAGAVETSQNYLRNTPVLVTRHTDARGNAVEITDFCPRFQQMGRMYRPGAFVRILRPVAGSPRVRVRLRPSADWGAAPAERTRGSNHIRYGLAQGVLRLSTTAPVGWIEEESEFRVERPMHFFLGPDESFAGAIGTSLDAMLDRATASLCWAMRSRACATVASALISTVTGSLERATPFLRRQIGRRLRLKNVPSLEFFYDDTIADAHRMEELLMEVREERRLYELANPPGAEGHAEPGPGAPDVEPGEPADIEPDAQGDGDPGDPSTTDAPAEPDAK